MRHSPVINHVYVCCSVHLLSFHIDLLCVIMQSELCCPVCSYTAQNSLSVLMQWYTPLWSVACVVKLASFPGFIEPGGYPPMESQNKPTLHACYSAQLSTQFALQVWRSIMLNFIQFRNVTSPQLRTNLFEPSCRLHSLF